MKKKIVVLSGAGMSAESGISTFRDAGGLWENYDVMQVAHIDSWQTNRDLMLKFYNERRKQLASVEPHEGHKIIAELEADFEVVVVTQNVDNLHERAGSSNVIHLHGELTKACSSKDKECVVDIGYNEIHPGDQAADGSQLRPFIVWFGEAVPEIERAAFEVSQADILIIVGTSMQVYPAAGLIHYARRGIPIYLIDPAEVNVPARVEVIRKTAGAGLALLKEKLVP
ncbi:MAG: NAD-dependent protein deacylase [Candidatus Azobacteroides sp.]|nr:NAD-dependent protein deacylase [Candidatus Azobacteroides sp.]